MNETTNKAVPARRVGSLTLGICLIAMGVFFLCYFFVPGFPWRLALKIAPAAGLILLGTEVLFFSVRPWNWKYDGVSVLLCLLLLLSGFGGSCLIVAAETAMEWERISQRAELERWENETDPALRKDLDEGTGPDQEEENQG